MPGTPPTGPIEIAVSTTPERRHNAVAVFGATPTILDAACNENPPQTNSKKSWICSGQVTFDITNTTHQDRVATTD